VRDHDRKKIFAERRSFLSGNSLMGKILPHFLRKKQKYVKNPSRPRKSTYEVYLGDAIAL